MMNKEQMMEKTKLELNKMLAQVGNNISASKLKNTNKETLVQMIFDAQPIDIPAEGFATFTKTKGKIVVPNQAGGDVVVTPAKSTGKGAVAKIITDVLENGETAQKNLDQKNAELDAIINDDDYQELVDMAKDKNADPIYKETLIALNKNYGNEPKNIDEMFDGKVVSLADVKEQKNLKNGKTPKSSSRPDYDKLYDEFKKALKNDMGLNLFANRTNRLGEMKALTHVKGMQWAVIITKSGFRFELYMQDDEKGINELYLAMKKDGQDSTKIVGPTGKSTRHKICVTYDGHDAKAHAKLFNEFYKHLMVGINELYPQETTETKTA